MANFSLTDALDTITAGITNAIADPQVSIADHPGRFTEAELGALITKKRSIRIAIEQIPEIAILGPGTHRATLIISAFIICSDTTGTDRHRSAINLAEILLKVLPHNRWQSEHLTAVLPGSIQADNLYSADIERKGVAIWAIAWQQSVKNT